jgi:molybdopterin-biosynthesis enzyme MoeA-like protein
MTLQGIASGLHRKMVPSRPGLKLIREHYAETGRADFRMTPARRKMAILPEGAEPLLNRKGTAPGVRIKDGETLVFCLPGVPTEMKDIFRRSVEPEIRSMIGQLFRVAARLRLEGIFESVLAPTIAEELKEHPGAYIKSHPRGIREGVSRIELDVVVVNRSRDRAKSEVKSIVNEVAMAIRRSGGRITSAQGIGI